MLASQQAAAELRSGLLTQLRRDGMKKGAARLLEPIMKVEVTTPEEHMGDVIGDLNSRRGVVAEFLDRPGNLRLIKSFVPLSEMFNYISNLRGAAPLELWFWSRLVSPGGWEGSPLWPAVGVAALPQVRVVVHRLPACLEATPTLAWQQ